MAMLPMAGLKATDANKRIMHRHGARVRTKSASSYLHPDDWHAEEEHSMIQDSRKCELTLFQKVGRHQSCIISLVYNEAPKVMTIAHWPHDATITSLLRKNEVATPFWGNY